MYAVFGVLGEVLVLAAATRAQLALDGEPGARLEALCVFHTRATPAPRDLVLSSRQNERLAVLRWTGAALEAREVETRVLGQVSLLLARTRTEQGVVYALLSRVWSGAHLIPQLALQAPGAGRGKKHRLTGWSSTGQATPVSVAAVATETGQGYLIWGGDAGLRAGGHGGFTLPALFVDETRALPLACRRALFLGPPEGA